MAEKKVFCPGCREAFELKKSSGDGDLIKCKKCGVELEIIEKRKNKIDVILVQEEKEVQDLDDPEFGGYD